MTQSETNKLTAQLLKTHNFYKIDAIPWDKDATVIGLKNDTVGILTGKPWKEKKKTYKRVIIFKLK